MQLLESIKRNYELLQKNNRMEFLFNIKNNPSTIDIKRDITETNKDLIFQQRMNTLQKGDWFPKFGQKVSMNLFINYYY